MEVFISHMTHKKADTIDELGEILRTSESGLPAVRVWVHEVLEPVVKNFWKIPRKRFGADGSGF